MSYTCVLQHTQSRVVVDCGNLLCGLYDRRNGDLFVGVELDCACIGMKAQLKFYVMNNPIALCLQETLTIFKLWLLQISGF